MCELRSPEFKSAPVSSYFICAMLWDEEFKCGAEGLEIQYNATQFPLECSHDGGAVWEQLTVPPDGQVIFCPAGTLLRMKQLKVEG